MSRIRHLALPAGLVAALMATASQPALAQGAAPAAKAASPLEEIIVTGTRRADRTVASSPVPIDVLPTTELSKSGMGELNKVLNALVPSFNFPQPSITDGTDHIRPATLRGLSPDQTLVLINGKRRHASALVNVNGSIGRGSSAVDMNSIPTQAVERIEVLRDGAAAQYGSDAIAGVINVILKNNGSGISGNGTYGQYKKGDGTTWSLASNMGIPVGEDGGFLSVTAEWKKRDPTNRQGPDNRCQYTLVAATTFCVNQIPPGATSIALPPAGTVIDPREASFNRTGTVRYGESKLKDVNLWANFGLPTSAGFELYAYANYSKRDGESGGNFRRAIEATNIRSIYPNGFLPLITSKITDYSVVGGAKGEMGGWDWDLSLDYGANKFQFGVENSLNASMGALSPTSFPNVGTLEIDQMTANFDMRKAFDVGLAKDLNVAIGAEYRNQGFELGAGIPASYIYGGGTVPVGQLGAGGISAPGAQVFPGFRPADAIDKSRDAVSAYIDLDTNLTPDWNVSAAVRGENYSDFGSTISGKLATRYEFSPAFAIRGAVSNGFRAPSLQQSYFSSTATNFIGGVPFEVRTFRVTDGAARALGAQDLKAEKSVNFSGGITTQPWEGFYGTVDFYQISIKDRIVLSSNIVDAGTSTTIRNFLTAQGFVGVTGGRFFTNAVDTRTQGVDIVGRQTIPLDTMGTLSLTAGINFNTTKITSIKPFPPTIAALGVNAVRFGVDEATRIEKGQPKDKVNLSAGWEVDRWDITVRGTRYGKVTTSTTGGILQTFSAKWIADADISYEVIDGVKLSVGANNLFDTYPDIDLFNNNNGINQYSNASPFGFNGAYYYGRVDFKF